MSDRDCGTKFELCGDCVRCLRHQRDYARERLKDAASDLADLTDQHEVLRAEVERLRDSGTVLVRSLERMTAERDEAQAEVERLRRERDEALVESAQRALSVIALDRDEARAEVERLRRNLEYQAAEAASWRATARDKGYSAREVAKERDEAQKQARLAWERQAEKDRAYGEALRERDEARAELAFVRMEYGQSDPAGLTRDALELKCASLAADLQRLCEVVLALHVLRKSCDECDANRPFRVHLKEPQFDALIERVREIQHGR